MLWCGVKLRSKAVQIAIDGKFIGATDIYRNIAIDGTYQIRNI
jgi:hypothetical protein